MSKVEPPLSIALVTDIHHGAPAGTKTGTTALPLLAGFAQWANGLPLDLVVEMGDRINNGRAEEDMRLTREVAKAFSAFRAPRAHILGNHDNHDLSRSKAEEAMDLSFASWSRDTKGFHLVFWNADTHIGPDDLRYSDEDLAWLEADLTATELPTVVFTHVPLDDGSMIGNFYFEKYFASLASYRNSEQVRAVLEQSGKVILCVAGHTHWNKCNTIDGIHYLTLQSLTESYTTWPHAAGSFGLLQLGEQISFEVFGRDPAYFRLPIRPLGRHWINLSRPYAPRPEGLSPWWLSRMAALDKTT